MIPQGVREHDSDIITRVFFFYLSKMYPNGYIGCWLFLQEQIKDHHHPSVAFPGGFRVNLTGNQKDKVIWRRGPGWRIHGSVEDTKLSTNKQHTHSLSTPNPGKFGAVAEGDLYQPETRPEPVKKGGVLVPNIPNLPTWKSSILSLAAKSAIFGFPQIAGPKSSPPVRHALFDEFVMEPCNSGPHRSGRAMASAGHGLMRRIR